MFAIYYEELLEVLGWWGLIFTITGGLMCPFGSIIIRHERTSRDGLALFFAGIAMMITVGYFLKHYGGKL